jgi:hypothetical protein
MRTTAMVIGFTVVCTALAEAQATASPSSRVIPSAPARGIRTEPPPNPGPGQTAQPAQQPARDPAASGPAPVYNVNYYTYGAGYGGAYSSPEVTYAQQPPPPSQIDVRGPQPGPATAFVPGYWTWTGSSYNWSEGRWVPIPAGYVRWVPGRWVQNQFGWYFLRGYWEP